MMLRGLWWRLIAAQAVAVAAAAAILAASGELEGRDLAAAVIGMAAAGLAGAILMLILLRHLSRFVEAAERAASGDLSRRVHVGPGSGLAELAEAFNQMTRSLEERIAVASQDRSRLMAALNSSSDAVVAVDGHGSIAFANTAARALSDRDRPDLTGKPFAWLVPDERLIEAIRASRQEGRREMLHIERPNRQHLQVIVTPIVGGGEWAALVVFHDVTDAKRVEQVRRDFVANVSHELRTPLASMKSVIETLQGGALEEQETARDFLTRMDMEVDRLVNLVEELLELSRIESGEVPLVRRPVSLGEVVVSAVERMRPAARRRRLELSVDVPRHLPAVAGDAARLERVVVSLVDNAIKFTMPEGAVQVSAAPADGSVAITVRDTGVGIDPEDLPRIFERFYKADRSRQAGGTGLGLAIVKHTLEAHGGSVAVESEPGRGSAFTIFVPVSSSPSEGG